MLGYVTQISRSRKIRWRNFNFRKRKIFDSCSKCLVKYLFFFADVDKTAHAVIVEVKILRHSFFISQISAIKKIPSTDTSRSFLQGHSKEIEVFLLLFLHRRFRHRKLSKLEHFFLSRKGGAFLCCVLHLSQNCRSGGEFFDQAISEELATFACTTPGPQRSQSFSTLSERFRYGDWIFWQLCRRYLL